MFIFPIVVTTALMFLILFYGAAWHDAQARPEVIKRPITSKPRRRK